MEKIIETLKKIRKKQTLEKKYNSHYAFVGIGNHSINNLYPVLAYLHAPLKYIVTKSETTATLINNNNFAATGTDNLDKVLSDKDIAGVFISANPNAHYELVKKCLLNGKNVFVEKPPCKTKEELNDLIATEQQTGKICVVGLQKRYSNCSKILSEKLNLKEVISYNYRFTTGLYPEGDKLLDLFIHPIDLISFLFGSANLISAVKTNAYGDTFFLQLKHHNIIGNIEISTQYSWNTPTEKLMINTADGVFEMTNHLELTLENKAGTLFSIPKEKIFNYIPEKKILFNGNNFLPVFENNQIVSQGYFSEIETFLNLCEKRKAKNKSNLSSLINTYQIISELRNV
jgi:virulence factor